MAPKNQRRGIPLLRAVLLAALAVALAAAAVKFYVGPRLVRLYLERAASAVWDGALRLEDADLDFSGMVRLRGLELADRDGHRWVRVGLARVRTGGWWSCQPTVRTAELTGVDCDLRLLAGSCKLPLKPGVAGRRSGLGIDRFLARPVTVRIVRDGKPAAAAEYKGIEINLDRNGGTYGFSISRRDDAAGETCAVTGTYNPRSRIVSARAVVVHAADVAETSALLRALGRRELAAVQGKLKAKAALRGSVDRLADCEHSLNLDVQDMRIDAPNGMIARGVNFVLEASNGTGEITSASLQAPLGRLKLKDVKLTYRLDRKTISAEVPNGVATLASSGPSSRFWEDILKGVTLAGTVNIAGSVDYDRSRGGPPLVSLRLKPAGLKATVPTKHPLVLDRLRWSSAVVTPRRVELAGMSAQSCDGTVGVDLSVDNWAAGGKAQFHAIVTASHVNLAKLSRSLGASPTGAPNGKTDLRLELTAAQASWQNVTGRGRIHITDGDFWSVPLLAHPFRQLGLRQNPATISEAHGVFSVAGPVLHIRHAAVANRLAGIEFTTGQVNLKTRDLDATFVGGTFLTMNRMGKLLIGNLKSKLLARRVRGKWDQLQPASFHPLPVGQIADSSVRFLLDVARNSGKFPAGILKNFQRLFETLRPRPPADAAR